MTLEYITPAPELKPFHNDLDPFNGDLDVSDELDPFGDDLESKIDQFNKLDLFGEEPYPFEKDEA